MDDTQFRAILAEMKESNKLMKAMVSELSQIKFELVNERLKRDAPKGATYTIPIPVKSGTPGIDGTSDIIRKTDTRELPPKWKQWIKEQMLKFERE